MKLKMNKNMEPDDEKSQMISRKVAVKRVINIALLTAASMMILMPTKQAAAASPDYDPSSSPPPLPSDHGID